MRRLVAPLAVVLLALPAAACAQPGGGGGSPSASAGDFDALAADVADAWAAAPARDAWRTGYVPLENPLKADPDARFDVRTKEALGRQTFRLAVELPARTPAEGTIRFPDGSMTVPLISAAEAYGRIDMGDPPPCPTASAEPPPPPPSDAGPDTSVSSGIDPADCGVLTVTDVALGQATLRTSRGEAQVPAWRFAIRELGGKVVTYAAVAAEAVSEVPAGSPAARPVAGLVAAQGLTGIDGTTLRFTLGVGACDEDVTPLFLERADVVVVGGTVKPPSGDMACIDLLEIRPVEVTLAAPLGARAVLDAVTAQPLILTVR
jgi:hypothetical protein